MNSSPSQSPELGPQAKPFCLWEKDYTVELFGPLRRTWLSTLSHGESVTAYKRIDGEPIESVDCAPMAEKEKSQINLCAAKKCADSCSCLKGEMCTLKDAPEDMEQIKREIEENYQTLSKRVKQYKKPVVCDRCLTVISQRPNPCAH